MGVMPINIPIPAESSIATYSWTDIISGLGVGTFYISKFTQSTGDFWKIVQEQFISANTGSTSMGSTGTVDMSPFNSPRTINGNVVVSCVASTVDAHWRISATLYKYSALGVETAISATVETGDMHTTDRTLLSIPVSNALFGKGDLFRLKYTSSGNSFAVGANTLAAVGNPLVTDQSFKIYVPFKIEL